MGTRLRINHSEYIEERSRQSTAIMAATLLVGCRSQNERRRIACRAWSWGWLWQKLAVNMYNINKYVWKQVKWSNGLAGRQMEWTKNFIFLENKVEQRLTHNFAVNKFIRSKINILQKIISIFWIFIEYLLGDNNRSRAWNLHRRKCYLGVIALSACTESIHIHFVCQIFYTWILFNIFTTLDIKWFSYKDNETCINTMPGVEMVLEHKMQYMSIWQIFCLQIDTLFSYRHLLCADFLFERIMYLAIY